MSPGYSRYPHCSERKRESYRGPASLRIVRPTYPTFISMMMKILTFPLPRRRGRWLLNPSPSTPASSSTRCFSIWRSRLRISKTRWFGSVRQLFFKKTQQLVFRLDYSNKSIHCRSRNPPMPPKEELGLPRHHNVIENQRIPPAAQGVTGRRPTMMMNTLRIQNVPEAQSFLTYRTSQT